MDEYIRNLILRDMEKHSTAKEIKVAVELDQLSELKLQKGRISKRINEVEKRIESKGFNIEDVWADYLVKK